jgi:serine/threonine protein kinase
MAMTIKCPQCETHYRNIPEQCIGKTTRCKKCGMKFRAVAVTTSPVQAVKSPSSKPPIRDDAMLANISQQEWATGDVILDLYEISGILGKGGMGKVYKVHHREWNVDLAVKSPLPHLFADKNAVENFAREAETWVNLGLYPHIVSCYYVRTIGGIPRVFAEYVTGGSLKEWIKSRKLYAGSQTLAIERLLDIAIQFAWGLHFAHEQGLIHQDVKPANVMLTPDGIAKVTDFGLAKARVAAGEQIAIDSQHSLLVSSGGMTPAYCSPEQANQKVLGRRTDLWSWAVSLLEMFVGDVIWKTGTIAGLSFPTYLEMGYELFQIPMPESLADLLRKCFQENPNDRPKDFCEVAATLQQIYQDTIGQS